MNTIIFLSIILFLVGLYFYAKTTYSKYSEGLTNSTGNTQARCPNMLVQKGSSFYLYNSNLPFVWGPVSGLDNMPRSFLTFFPFSMMIKNGIWNFFNDFQFHTSARIKKNN